MITAAALDVQNRMRADRPLVVVVTRRRLSASDDAVRAVTAAARDEEVDALALDVDDAGNTALLDELRVRVVPEVFVCARGVVLDRGHVAGAADARAVISAALRRSRR